MGLKFFEFDSSFIASFERLEPGHSVLPPTPVVNGRTGMARRTVRPRVLSGQIW